ncbi:MAG TPA: hypothetical protein VJ724_15555, partial [Tahibacter sp.]|nr:hypothetical protein [Tahibacter sp.]
MSVPTFDGDARSPFRLRISRAVFARCAVALAALVAPGACIAQSWLTNGGFDGGTNGWAVSPGNDSSFGFYDATEGYTSPGAATILVGFDGDSIAYSQCVDMTPQTVDLVFYSKVVESGGGANIGSGSVSFFATTGCSSTYIDNRAISRVESLAGGWKRQTLLGVAAPAATRSAMVVAS